MSTKRFFSSYPASLLVVPHVVHLKKVSVDRVVSPPTSTVHVSLSFLPHDGHTTFTVGSGLSDFSSLLSITAISSAGLWCRFVFCFASSLLIVFWYLHFGHASEGFPLLAILRTAPH
jgi:hypothetical protein